MYVFQKSAAKVEADQLKRKKWRELKWCWKRQMAEVKRLPGASEESIAEVGANHPVGEHDLENESNIETV